MRKKLKKFNKINLLTYLFFAVFVISIFVSVKVFAQIEEIKLSDVEIVEKSSGVTGDITSTTSNEVKDTITFHKLNDYVVYKIKVKNNLDKNIAILSISDNNTNEHVSYEYDKHENEIFNAGDSFDLLVKVTYVKEVTDMTKRDQSSDVKLTINYDDSGVIKGSSIGINPKTNDNINISYIILAISGAGLIICLIIKGKSSKGVYALIAAAIMIPLGVKAEEFIINFSFKTDYEFYDKVILTYNVGGEEKEIIVPYGDELDNVNFPGLKEGYSVTNWKNENGEDINDDTKLTEDSKLTGSVVYSATPEIRIKGTNRFSYSAPNAKAFYISKSSSIPDVSTPQDTFSLDKWTTSLYTNSLTLGANNVIYVYVMDEDNNISVNRTEIPVRKLEVHAPVGTSHNLTCTSIYDPGEIQTIIDIPIIIISGEPSDVDRTQYVLNGLHCEISFTQQTGYKNMVTTRNGISFNSNLSEDITENVNYTATVETKNYILSIDPNGGVYNDTTGLSVKTMIYRRTQNYNIGVPTREGYKFTGWYTQPVGGDMVYSSSGDQATISGSTYWKYPENTYGSKAYWVYDNDLTVYAHWEPIPVLTTVDYNTFSYTCIGATAYYVSTSDTRPSDGPVQDNFELNKWTTATITNDLDLSSNPKFYVWAKNENGDISQYYSKTYSYFIKATVGNNATLDARLYSSEGEPLSFDSQQKAYVLYDTDIYMNAILDEGYEFELFGPTLAQNPCNQNTPARNPDGSYNSCYADDYPTTVPAIFNIKNDSTFKFNTTKSLVIIVNP